LINPNFSFYIFVLLLTLTGDGWLPLQETQIFFVDDPGKLYRQRRRATQAKGLEILDPKAKVEGPSKSPRESPPLSKDAGRPFKIKRRMEKMEIEKEAQHLKAAEARSTCKDCEEYDHVQGRHH
jgi:hypothetical protein